MLWLSAFATLMLILLIAQAVAVRRPIRRSMLTRAPRNFELAFRLIPYGTPRPLVWLLLGSPDKSNETDWSFNFGLASGPAHYYQIVFTHGFVSKKSDAGILCNYLI